MIRGLFACIAYRSLSSWLVVGPLGLAIGAILAHHPRGDGALFDSGGLWLFEAARKLIPMGPGLALSTGVIALMAAFGWLLPLSLLLAEIAGHRGRAALAAAAPRLGTLSLLLGAHLFIEAMIGASAAVSGAAGGLAAWLSLAFAALLLFATGIAHDAARVSRFHGAEGALSAIVQGVTLLRRPILWWSGAWRGALSLLALSFGVAAAVFLAPTSAGAALLAPQLGIIGHIAARASWLAALSRAARNQGLPVTASMH